MTMTFRTSSQIVTGWGCVEGLGDLTDWKGTALLVTGRKALRAAGSTDRLVGLLRKAGVEATVFAEVPPEPTVECVDAGRRALAEYDCSFVVSAGGGSAVDVGKAVAGLAHGDAATGDYFSDRPLPEDSLPHIAIPTTSGTGAEVTNNSVLTDAGRGVKQSIRPFPMPWMVLLDPELTVSCPPEVTAAAGMDALVQGVESYLSKNATPLTDAMSRQAVALVAAGLVAAWRDGTDRAAREAMAYGSLLAGMALTNCQLGAVHGVAHPIGFRYHIPHGIICAAMLPHVLRFNREAAGEKYADLGTLFGGDPAERSAELLRTLGLPERLGPLGMKEEDFDAMAAESMPSGSLKANPRPASEADVRMLLGQAL